MREGGRERERKRDGGWETEEGSDGWREGSMHADRG